MENVSFIIWNYGNMCRIETSSINKDIRNMCDGSCITSLDILLYEIDSITEECKKLGYSAKFESINVYD